MSRAVERLPDRTQVLIVGAGLAGAATAHHLRLGGVEPLLLDRAPAAGREASGRSAGMIRAHCADPALAEWTAAGARAHRTSGFPGYRPTGSLLLGLGDQDVSDMIPWAVGRGLHQPGDGVIDAPALLLHLLAGQSVAWGVQVDAVAPSGAGVAVHLEGRTLRADVVVLAAGAFAGALGGLPLQPRRRHLFRTARRPEGPCEPFVWDVVEGLYFRSEGEGLLACACDEEATPPGVNAVREGAQAELRAKARQVQPALADLAIADSWAGQRTFAPDERFVLGWDPALPGVFWVAGLGGHGVTVAPVVGARAAERILSGSVSGAGDDRALSPARFR